jgi:hypothetical protein
LNQRAAVPEILAVCFTAFEPGQDITGRVADLLTLVAAIPESVLVPGQQLRTLPDGTVLGGRAWCASPADQRAHVLPGDRGPAAHRVRLGLA